MNVTTTRLTAAAGLAAAAAGTIFIGVQIGHPPMDSFLTDTDQWVARCAAKAVMATLALAGITGLYLRQARQARALGLVGYLLFSAGYLFMLATELTAVFVLPALTGSEPAFARDVVIAASGGQPTADIGHLGVLFGLMGAGYMGGGLVFGIALFRAGIVPRWAAALLACSTVATAALAVLPEAFSRPMAVPEGIALIGLGTWLWRDQRGQERASTAPATVPETAAALR